MTTRDAILDVLRRRKRTYHTLLFKMSAEMPEASEKEIWAALQELRSSGVVFVSEGRNGRSDRLDFYYRLRGER